MSTRPDFERYLEAIESETARFALVISDALESRVPSCPEWTGRELTDHMAQVFRFFARQLDRADPSAYEEVAAPVPGEEADPVQALTSAASRLCDMLRETGPERPCWNWSGADLLSGWVARRMALEVAVHRYDAEICAADTTPVASELAADGIDERINVHLRSDVPEDLGATLGGTLCLACSDDEAAFVVEVAGGRVRCRKGRGPAAAVLRGTASELFLFTWNRVALDQLELTGDRAVAAAWSSLPA